MTISTPLWLSTISGRGRGKAPKVENFCSLDFRIILNPIVPLSGLVQGAWSAWSHRSSGQVLILTDGLLHLYSLDDRSVKQLSCLENILSVYPDIEDQVLAVTSSGILFSVNIRTDTSTELSSQVRNVSHVSGSSHHTCLLEASGHVWTRGAPPQVGVVTATEDYAKLRISPGCEVTQLVTGDNFTAVIARRRKGDIEDPSPLETPDTDTKEIKEQDPRPVCPLGLHVSSQSNQNQNYPNVKQSNQTSMKDDSVQVSDIDLDMIDGPARPGMLNSEIIRPNFAVTNVMNQVSSQVSSLGRSVWSNSMSLLSLTSYSSQDNPLKEGEACHSDTDSETLSQHSVSALVKSQSEPPAADPRPRHRRLSDVSPRGRGGLVLSLGESDLEREGERLASAAVWTWGAGKRGQLGQGDTLARNNPCLVALPGDEARPVKLSAGSHHLLALSDTGQVWGWGDNTGGQAVYTDINAMVTYPHPVVLQAGEVARDIACHGNVSALLTNNLRCYVFGNIAGRSHVRMQVVDIASDLDIPDSIIPSNLFMTGSGCVVSCYSSDNHYREIREA